MNQTGALSDVMRVFPFTERFHSKPTTRHIKQAAGPAGLRRRTGRGPYFGGPYPNQELCIGEGAPSGTLSFLDCSMPTIGMSIMSLPLSLKTINSFEGNT